MVAAIVAVVGFVGFTLFNGGDDKPSNTAQVAEGSTPDKTAAKPTTTKPADPEPVPSECHRRSPRDKVTVKLGASQGKSWISVKDHNGRLLFDGLLLEGESKTFQDKERIDLVLGNAGAIELFVNGKKLQDRFEPGQVERLTYTKGDPEAG